MRKRELDLDDLDSDISDYILEDKLQQKFMKVFSLINHRVDLPKFFTFVPETQNSVALFYFGDIVILVLHLFFPRVNQLIDL